MQGDSREVLAMIQQELGLTWTGATKRDEGIPAVFGLEVTRLADG